MKKTIHNEGAAYVAPKAKVMTIHSRRPLSASNYGENGFAGGVFNSSNTNTYDGDSDLL